MMNSFHYHGKLLGSCPAFNLFFARDRASHILIALEPNEPIAIKCIGKPGDSPTFVLRDANSQVICHSAVEDTRPTGNNVDVVVMISLVHFTFR